MPSTLKNPNLFIAGAEWFTTRQGGMNRYFTGYVDALATHGQFSSVGSAFGDPPDVHGHSRGPADAPWWRRVRSVLVELPRAISAPIFDSHFAPYGVLAILVRRVLKRASLVHFHGPWAQESQVAGQSRWNVLAKKQIEMLAYRNATHCVVLSAAFKNLLVAAYGVHPDRISVIAGAISPAENTNQSCTKKIVLCVRRLEKRMGIADLLGAWPTVLAAQPDAELAIVGSGQLDEELRSLARQTGVSDTVTFHGRLQDDELTALYQSATVSVVPTVALEGFGLVLLESLTHGTPVIATRCGGMPDILEPFDDSLLVEPRRPDLLATRIIAALNGDVPSREAARGWAARFSWDRLVTEHDLVIARLLNAN